MFFAKLSFLYREKVVGGNNSQPTLLQSPAGRPSPRLWYAQLELADTTSLTRFLIDCFQSLLLPASTHIFLFLLVSLSSVRLLLTTWLSRIA